MTTILTTVPGSKTPARATLTLRSPPTFKKLFFSTDPRIASMGALGLLIRRHGIRRRNENKSFLPPDLFTVPKRFWETVMMRGTGESRVFSLDTCSSLIFPPNALRMFSFWFSDLRTVLEPIEGNPGEVRDLSPV